MKLLLLSFNHGAVPDFVAPGSHLGFIPTAAALDPNPWYVDRDRQQLRALGYNLVYIDLDHLSTPDINARLDAVDALYVTGGNTFYLMQQLQRKNIADTLVDRLRHGLPYIGASAGAAVLGPSLEPLVSLDDPADAPHLRDLTSLGVVKFVPLPHYGKPKYAHLYDQILADHSTAHQLVPFRDDQALLVTAPDHYKIIDSTPS
jgi:dipeptidase E